MGIIKREDVIAWEHTNMNDVSILCEKCLGGCKDEDLKPLTEQDVNDDDIVTCDECGVRIQ